MKINKTNISNLKNLVNALESYRKKILSIDYVHNKKEFFEIMKEIRKYFASIDNKDLYETFFHSKYYKFYEDFFTNMNMYYLRSIESIQSISIMTQGLHNFDSFAELMDREIIKTSFESKRKELEHVDFNSAKTLVMIGSGPLPESLLYIYENYDIKQIVGVDYNHEAVFMAGEMVSGLNLDNITFHQENGIHYDYSKADIIYMPLFTSPKSKILDRIVETGKDNVQILIANPKGFGNLLFEGLGDINPRLKISHREDASTSYNAQEVIKLEKYDF